MRRKIYAKDLKPGDLIFSHRTEQAMLVISSDVINSAKIKLSWLPLTGRGKMLSVDISPYNSYIMICQEQRK